jgi:preprotein translocase subunit SecF
MSPEAGRYSMEIFRNTNFDFLGKKWPFLILSAALLVAGVGSIVLKGGLRYGIDFRGGAMMTVKFAERPAVDRLRAALTQRIPGEVSVQSFTDIGAENEFVIGAELSDDQQLAETRHAMVEALEEVYGQPGDRLEFNNASQQALVDRLRDPLQRRGVALSEEELHGLVQRIADFRNTPPRSGLIQNFEQLAAVPGVTPAVIDTLKEEAYLAPFSIRQVEIVGPKIGADLKRQAILATLYALAGMLVYIAVRFEWIYGVGAVMAVFHDTIITIGLFSIFDKEINLTVVAALLTLVGYSMNDTIVIFDRVRENLRMSRREPLAQLINRSINQTLSRTVMTSGLTFLAVLALFLFGGPVLHPFSFALVVGIIVGTYSSLYIASPIILAWYSYKERKRTSASASAPARAQAPRRESPKAVK